MLNEKILTLSTSHLPFGEYQKLHRNGLFRISSHQFGIIVFLHNQCNLNLLKNEFPVLLKIIKYTMEHNIQYINFDCDGLVVEEFEKFNW